MDLYFNSEMLHLYSVNWQKRWILKSNKPNILQHELTYVHTTLTKLVIKVSNNSDNMKSVPTGIGGKSG